MENKIHDHEIYYVSMVFVPLDHVVDDKEKQLGLPLEHLLALLFGVVLFIANLVLEPV